MNSPFTFLTTDKLMVDPGKLANGRNLVLLLLLVSGIIHPGVAQVPACCQVSTVNPQQNVASAKVNASGKVFQFKANNPAAMGSIRVGQRIYANFQSNQISIDGRNIFGIILGAT